ncbi:MAG: very short patch repair endonuclease [Vicinamibacterales bacterium]
MDTLSPERRSSNMRQIKSKNTSPELEVRRYLHARGLRYQLHRRDLPGRPDLVLPAIQTCVFVHGCFWHGCRECVDGRRSVKSRSTYWKSKIAGNRSRDRRHVQALAKAGWEVRTIWECELRKPQTLAGLAASLLNRRAAQRSNRWA